MRSDECRRPHLACLDVAKQSSVPDAPMRWLAMAMSCFNLPIEPPERSLDGAEVKTALAEKASRDRRGIGREGRYRSVQHHAGTAQQDRGDRGEPGNESPGRKKWDVGNWGCPPDG